MQNKDMNPVMDGAPNPSTSARGASAFDPSHPDNSVSVIIPVYNGASFIRETLDSILAQTAPPAEVIVVNDGSTDNTASLVREYGPPVILIETPNQGACEARNLGASRATSNWIAPCDGDDLWLPTKLEKQLRLANEAPDIQCVLTDYAEITDGVVASRSHLSYAPPDYWVKEPHDSGFVVREPITGKLTTFQPGITSTQLVKRTFYHQIGGFDVKAAFGAEDTCFHFRCLSVVPFGVVPEVLMHYRRHPAAWSADSLKQLRNTVLVWEYMLANYPQTQPFRAELRKGMRAMRKEIAEMRIHRWKQKIKHLLAMLHINWK